MMKKSISNKIILMVVSFLLSIAILITINNFLVGAKAKDEKILENEQQHINLIKVLQSELGHLNRISYRISRLEDERSYNFQKKEFVNLLNEIEKITVVLLKGGTYSNIVKVNVYLQDKFEDQIVYFPFQKDFRTEIVELYPKIESLNEVSIQLILACGLHYKDVQNTEHLRKTNSLYKQLESLIVRSQETANRAYLQAQNNRLKLDEEMKIRTKRYQLYRYGLLFILLVGMLILLRKTLAQIYHLVDIHEDSKLHLEENNKTIQKILDSLPVGIALVNRKQEVQQINATALSWMKDTEESNYLNQHCGNVFCLEDEESCPMTSSKLAMHDIQLGLKQKDGGKSTVVKSAIPIRLQNQDMILEAFMDISKQKKAENDLLDQKKFTDAVLNSALVGIVVIDVETHEILSVNEKAREMIGDKEEDIIGKTCNKYMCPSDMEECPNADLDHQVLNQQKVLITASKEEKHILKSVKKAEINGKEVYVESFVDISERKKAELELQKLSKVVQESPNSIVITKSNGEIEYVNPAFEEVTGYKSAEVIGKNPRILNARNPENNVDYKGMWQRIVQGQVWKGEFCNRKKDGSIYWELASISPVKNSKNEITHFIAIKDDITQRKHFELQLQYAKENADKANKAKSFFLAKMSHEIRTPMNGIIGMTDILMEGTKDKDLIEKLKVVSVSAENLLTIINEILDFSKIEAGQVELESIPFDLKKLLLDVEGLLAIKAKEKNLYLKTRFSDQLPQYIIGDPTRIKQIIINLVNNAIKFTEEGGITVFLEKKRTQLKSNKFLLGISIIDTGIGISEEGKEKLFKAFSQTSNSTTRTHGGTGLGLLISKDLSVLMGGNIGVDSQMGEGSTFWVEMPTQEASPDQKKNYKPIVSTPELNRHLNILLAEDNRINQKIALINLEKLGHQVKIANNGKEAVDLFQEHKFDLILMDIQMPEMSGLEATGHIRQYEIKNKIRQKTPIIALTANALKTDKEKYIAAGMNDYLSKPFKQQELIEVLSGLY